MLTHLLTLIMDIEIIKVNLFETLPSQKKNVSSYLTNHIYEAQIILTIKPCQHCNFS